jgi:hypothetical protein
MLYAMGAIATIKVPKQSRRTRKPIHVELFGQDHAPPLQLEFQAFQNMLIGAGIFRTWMDSKGKRQRASDPTLLDPFPTNC